MADNSASGPVWFKEIIETYTALPSPPYCPSGMPNVWRLRVVIGDDLKSYHKATDTYSSLCDTVRDLDLLKTGSVPERAKDGWKSLTYGIELAPFDLRDGLVFLLGNGNKFSLLHRETADLLTGLGQPDDVRNMTVHGMSPQCLAIKMLCEFFADANRFEGLERVCPMLKSMILPLGTWRPAKLVMHDIATENTLTGVSLQMTGRMSLQQLNDWRLGRPASSLGLPNLLGTVVVPLQGINKEHPSLGVITRCKSCLKVGVQNPGHRLLPVFMRCGGCQIHW